MYGSHLVIPFRGRQRHEVPSARCFILSLPCIRMARCFCKRAIRIPQQVRLRTADSRSIVAILLEEQITAFVQLVDLQAVQYRSLELCGERNKAYEILAFAFVVVVLLYTI